jgi:hypothetical protein
MKSTPMVKISDAPSWAILAGIGGIGFILIQGNTLPAIYNLFGTVIPLGDLTLLLTIIGIVIGLYYQIDNL